MAITAMVVDDEPLAADGLRRLCERSGRVNVLCVASDGASVLRLVTARRPQALFLDIAMPGLSGLDVAGALASIPEAPRIVLVTAHDHFATQAFDLSVVDYVLKPVEPQRFLRAIERLESVLNADPCHERAGGDLWVPYRGTVIRLSARDIVRLEAERDYVRLHDPSRSYLLRSTLTELLERLGPEFVRVHRSVALPASRIVGLRHAGSGAWVAVDVDGRAIPVGRTYLDSVRLRLGLT